MTAPQTAAERVIRIDVVISDRTTYSESAFPCASIWYLRIGITCNRFGFVVDGKRSQRSVSLTDMTFSRLLRKSSTTVWIRDPPRQFNWMLYRWKVLVGIANWPLWFVIPFANQRQVNATQVLIGSKQGQIDMQLCDFFLKFNRFGSIV